MEKMCASFFSPLCLFDLPQNRVNNNNNNNESNTMGEYQRKDENVKKK